jgi:hypothetical protein
MKDKKCRNSDCKLVGIKRFFTFKNLDDDVTTVELNMCEKHWLELTRQATVKEEYQDV